MRAGSWHNLKMATDRAQSFLPQLARAAFSIWIVFHLFVLLIIPNADNELGRRLEPFVKPYAQFFELTNAWSFFAPEPGPPPVYIEYEVLDRFGNTLKKSRWPDDSENLVFRDRLNRRIAVAEYMISSEVRAEKMILPYLCAKFPEAKSARIWRALYSIPSIKGVADGKEKIGDINQVQRQLVSHSYCEGRAR